MEIDLHFVRNMSHNITNQLSKQKTRKAGLTDISAVDSTLRWYGQTLQSVSLKLR